ncbi:hypothetical protein PM3_0073 [Pasteurella multocida]|nr:hypothetical protein PM3_0073 [Pasteurella multocida]
MINDDMCRNLSVLFYNFYEKIHPTGKKLNYILKIL